MRPSQCCNLLLRSYSRGTTRISNVARQSSWLASLVVSLSSLWNYTTINKYAPLFLAASKHWPANSQDKLWEWVRPYIKKILDQKSNDTLPVWTSFLEVSDSPRGHLTFILIPCVSILSTTVILDGFSHWWINSWRSYGTSISMENRLSIS